MDMNRNKAIKQICKFCGCNATEAQRLLSCWIHFRWFNLASGKESLQLLMEQLDKSGIIPA